MEQKKIDRINELARKARQGALTASEQTEREALRREYIESFKASLIGQLENTYIQRPDGTREKLKKRED